LIALQLLSWAEAARAAEPGSKPQVLWKSADHHEALWLAESLLSTAIATSTPTAEDLASLPFSPESREVFLRNIGQFRDRGPGGWVTPRDVEEGTCPWGSLHERGYPLTDAPLRSFAEVVRAHGSGFVAATTVAATTVGWSPAWDRVASLADVTVDRVLWSAGEPADVPVRFEILASGGWMSLAGVILCYSPSSDQGRLVPGDELLVWGDEDPANPGFVLTQLVLLIREGQVDTSACASCSDKGTKAVQSLATELSSSTKGRGR